MEELSLMTIFNTILIFKISFFHFYNMYVFNWVIRTNYSKTKLSLSPAGPSCQPAYCAQYQSMAAPAASICRHACQDTSGDCRACMLGRQGQGRVGTRETHQKTLFATYGKKLNSFKDPFLIHLEVT